MKALLNLNETIELINQGRILALAGDQSLLEKLPQGQWIGGTIPYFMGDEGGLFTKDFIQVTEFPDFVKFENVQYYDDNELKNIPAAYPKNGFSFIIIPSGSNVHLTYAKNCSTWKGFYDSPILGWITGVDLNQISKDQALVFNGTDLSRASDKALVMNLSLPDYLFSQINILNLFDQGRGDEISFPQTGFEIENCIIKNQQVNFSHYLKSINADIKLPLVANYQGAMINSSFQKINELDKKVLMYAPVFKGIKYKIAAPLKNYAEQFNAEVKKHSAVPQFSCNCILNYLYAELEGKKTGNITGPMTFGEIAYILLNQTMVYMTFEKK